MEDAEEALKDTRLKVPDEVTEETCDLCGRNLVVKSGRFGKFLACPGYPECKFTKPIVERMPGRCPRCGSTIPVLHHRSLHAFTAGRDIVDLDVGQALGAVNLDVLGVAVDFGARHGGGARNMLQQALLFFYVPV